MYAEFAPHRPNGDESEAPGDMFDLLAQCEWAAEDLAREMDITIANTSQHLC